VLIYYFIYTTHVHLAGVVRKIDIQKYMWVYLNIQN